MLIPAFVLRMPPRKVAPPAFVVFLASFTLLYVFLPTIDRSDLWHIEQNRLHVFINRHNSWISYDVAFHDHKIFLKFDDEHLTLRIASDESPFPKSELRIEYNNNENRLVHSGSVQKIPRVHDKIVLSNKPINASQDVPYIFQSSSLPEQKFMPEVGNGHIATVINGKHVFINGLYNGEETKSGRAAIPSLVRFRIELEAKADLEPVDVNYALNVREGIFYERRVYERHELEVVREVFAHRVRSSLLSVRIWARLKDTADEGVILRLKDIPDQKQLTSPDITFSSTVQFPMDQYRLLIADGWNNQPEIRGSPRTNVTVAWTAVDDRMKLEPGQTKTMTVIVSIGVSHQTTLQDLKDALKLSYDDLKSEHISAWLSHWDNGFIEVDPVQNLRLTRAIYASFYYLLSSVPDKQDPLNPFIGLSPGGLARGRTGSDYCGHVFWDMETWMYPPVLYFNPHLAELMLLARNRTFDVARKNAETNGYKGAQYPWESAFSGIETSPWNLSGLFEVHVTGDIALAIQQYLYLTDHKADNIKALNLKDIAVGIAKFWQSRSSCNADLSACHITGVMPPDEYHFNVSDSAYTNAVAALSLRLPSNIYKILGEADSRLAIWEATANALPLETATLKDGRTYHPEFFGYSLHDTSPNYREPWRPNNVVKQADVILLGYPLGVEMSRDVRQNDLDLYLPVTDASGPAMTWGMFSVGYLELGMQQKADELFFRNYDNIVEPFQVWSEEPKKGGAVNFLTGMGGFLQSIINGYGGLRIFENYVSFDPRPLPGTTRWSIVGFKYVGWSITLQFDFSTNRAIMICKDGPSDGRLRVSGLNVSDGDCTKDLLMELGKFEIRSL